MKSTGHSVIAAMLRGLRDLNGLKGLINVCVYIYIIIIYIYNIRAPLHGAGSFFEGWLNPPEVCLHALEIHLQSFMECFK